MAQDKRRQSDKDTEIILTKLEYIIQDINDLKRYQEKQAEYIERCYVSKTEFDPIKKLVFGAVGLILAAVIGAIITLVVRA